MVVGARFIRIGATVIHVPSLANVSMTSNCFGRPYLSFHYHNHKEEIVTYRTWEECEKDHVRMMTVMKQIERCLEAVPLTEEGVAALAPTVASVSAVASVATAASAPSATAAPAESQGLSDTRSVDKYYAQLAVAGT